MPKSSLQRARGHLTLISPISSSAGGEGADMLGSVCVTPSPRAADAPSLALPSMPDQASRSSDESFPVKGTARICPKCNRSYEGAASFCQKDGTRLELDGTAVDPYLDEVLLGQFRIAEPIGAGGMGTVYRARQTTLERDVAIKILHSELADNTDALRRFRREARVCTALDHPNVVRVLLFGQLDDGSPYIIMEFLKGRPLKEVIDEEGALPVHRALHVATQICDGVGEAHNLGVVHRDLKPENIVLVRKGADADHVKVLDFGIARVLSGEDQTQATQTGLVFGTARYISPEGAAGDATDARSDVYSIGVLVYQLLSGKTPFEGPSPVALLMKHIHGTPPHLRSLEGGRHVPEPVADVIMRALSKNAEGRYDDAHAFGRALRQAAERSGFEVRGHQRTSPSISEPGGRPAPTLSPADRRALKESRRPDLDTTDRVPLDTEAPILIPGLGSSGLRKWTLLLAFLLGSLIVGGAYYYSRHTDSLPSVEVRLAELGGHAREALADGRLDHMHEASDESVSSVDALTSAMLALDPQNAEALELREQAASLFVGQAEARAEVEDKVGAQALYLRARDLSADDTAIDAALEVLRGPAEEPLVTGLRTEPEVVLAGQTFSIVHVAEEGDDLGNAIAARFAIKRGRRQVGRSLAATVDDDGRTYRAQTRLRRTGRYELIFRVGRGDGHFERRISLQVQPDPNRPRTRRSSDPPPTTTQGSYSPPAPVWLPAVQQAEPSPIPGPPAPTPPAPQVVAAPPPPPPPPPPPAPWTGTGAI